MENFTNNIVGSQQVLFSAFDSLLSTLAAYLPNILGALIILVLGYIVSKALKGVTLKILKWSGFTTMVENMEFNKHLKHVGSEHTISQLLAGLVYWIVFITFLIGVFEILGLSVAVVTLSSLVAYLPNVIIAAITIVLAMVVGRFAHRMVDAGLAQFNISFGGVAAVVAESAIILFGVVIAANQLGFNVTIITANVSIIVAGVMVMFALSLGLGSRTVASNVLGGYYTKQMYKKGDTITLSGHTGTVKAVTSVSVVVATDRGEVIIPNEVALKNGSLTQA